MLHRRTATLVVIEYGGSWPRWLDVGTPGLGAKPQAAAAACVMMVAQHYEGLPSSLLTQVASRVTRMESAGWSLGNVVLVCNERVDVEAVTARSILARGLVERARARPTVRGGVVDFVLALAEHSDGRARQALVKLAATLETPPPHTGCVRLSVRIGQGEPLYGHGAAAA
jgi:hypothetical protein